MNKKQVMVAWGKKTFAFILDLFFIWLLLFPFDLVVFLTLGFFFGRGFVKNYLTIIEDINCIVMLIFYFVVLPQKFGNTFARKLLKIQDKFNLFWMWPFLREKYFLQKYLRKDGVLKVTPKDGKWICPSCNETSLEMYDVCSNCGQEVEK